MRVSVASGVDWFELHGEVEYGGVSAKLPALLAALRRGENMVLLDDGSYGLLPEEWLTRFGSLAGLGDSGKDHIRFQRNQVGLLDALLAAQPEISCDETFARARDALRNFEGIARPSSLPASSGSCATTSAKAWAGWSFCARSVSAAAWPTIWASARLRRCWRMLEDRRALRVSQNGNARPDVRDRRWWWFRNRWFSTGSRKPRASRRAARARPHRVDARNVEQL